MKVFLFIAIGLIPSLLLANIDDNSRELFGIHRAVSGGAYSFVKYSLNGPDFETILTFDSSLGDVWELAYNTENRKFYSYAKTNYNTQSVLLEINAATATVTNLGQITVNIGNNTKAAICTTDGLTYNQSTNELIGTVDIICGSWRAFRVVKFNLASLGSGNVTCVQIGTLSAFSNIEYDAIAMALNNSLEGMDPDIPSNNLKFYSTANVSNSIGTTAMHVNMTNWAAYRGMAFNLSENKIYSFQGQNGLRWLARCNPSYVSNPYVFEQMVQYDLSGFEVRGIVFGSIADEPLSIENIEVPVEPEIELYVFPNPTTGSVELNIDGDVVPQRILIIDVTGKIVYRANDEEVLTRKLNLSFLPDGTYLMSVIFDSNKNSIVRIIKQ
jgi:hypothetical protein